MKKYIAYLFKSKFKLLIAITIGLFILTYLNISGCEYEYTYNNTGEITLYLPSTPFVSYLIIYVFIKSFENLKFKFNKREVDSIYSLPIKKEKLFFSRMIVGFIQIIIPFTVSFIFSFIYALCNTRKIAFGYFAIHYFALVILALVFYIIINFLIFNSNKKIDAYMNIIIWYFIITLIPSAFNYLAGTMYNYDVFKLSEYYFAPASYISSINQIFVSLIVREDVHLLEYGLTNIIISTTFYVVIAILSCFYIYFNASKESGEKTLSISSSYFSYRVMIPTLIVMLSITDNPFIYIGSIIFYACLGYFAFALYQRKLAIKPRYILILALCFVFAGVLCYIINNCYNYDDNVQYILGF